MTWSIQYRLSGADMTVQALTPEEAVRAACHLLDDGYEVCGIGTGTLTHMIGKEDIARIYALWVRAKPGNGSWGIRNGADASRSIPAAIAMSRRKTIRAVPPEDREPWL
jgi:hypothetical protein